MDREIIITECKYTGSTVFIPNCFLGLFRIYYVSSKKHLFALLIKVYLLDKAPIKYSDAFACITGNIFKKDMLRYEQIYK